MMPTIRFFKIGVNFDMVKEEGAAENYSPDGYKRTDGESWKRPVPVSEIEIDFIRELQEDLPLVSRPFEPMAERLGSPSKNCLASPTTSRIAASCGASARSSTTAEPGLGRTRWLYGRSRKSEPKTWEASWPSANG